MGCHVRVLRIHRALARVECQDVSGSLGHWHLGAPWLTDMRSPADCRGCMRALAIYIVANVLWAECGSEAWGWLIFAK